MKTFLKYLGVFLVLAGVGIIIAYSLTETPSNSYLWTSLGFMIGGLVAYVLLNKYIKD